MHAYHCPVCIPDCFTKHAAARDVVGATIGLQSLALAGFAPFAVLCSGRHPLQTVSEKTRRRNALTTGRQGWLLAERWRMTCHAKDFFTTNFVNALVKSIALSGLIFAL